MVVKNILNLRFVAPKTKSALKSVLFLSTLFLLGACADKPETAAPENYSVKNNIITLTENSTIKSRLVIASPTEELVNIDLVVNGFVKAIPSQYAQIAPPFAGRITQSYIKLGQKVNVGTPIFSLSSSDYYAAQQDYLANVQELKNAEINLKRQQDLFDNAVGVKRELEEAQTDYSIKKLAVDNATASLRVYNVNPATMKMGEALVITSPIAGTVISNDLILGQYIKEDSEPLVTVAELNKVWVAAQVKEKDLAILNDLDEVELTSEAYSNLPFTGKVVNIGQVVNEETRSVEILIEVDNTKNSLKPGMYVSVKLKDTGKQTLVVPAKAVFQQNDSQFVYVQVGPDQFKKQNVTTFSTEDANKTAILEGLNATDKIITDGGIYLLQAK
ncbi:efflux RND transporter periplasmic adaptor subunit [Flavobacterium agricola]|uniref:Efflux RND transporter periplasmic adaptor subunit n=1 Tax=Flavobacterium agricola TaxID=2870839 RepID=A0ABY6LXW3_9FLAO|nr:efflux RND transporter periplasmic adaptor subunit [Flavobacterium agricola]UYW01079.1 efflux RND transporter periplasmic adaptor subunit [Flavobacterium agricola]